MNHIQFKNFIILYFQFLPLIFCVIVVMLLTFTHDANPALMLCTGVLFFIFLFVFWFRYFLLIYLKFTDFSPLSCIEFTANKGILHLSYYGFNSSISFVVSISLLKFSIYSCIVSTFTTIAFNNHNFLKFPNVSILGQSLNRTVNLL